MLSMSWEPSQSRKSSNCRFTDPGFKFWLCYVATTIWQQSPREPCVTLSPGWCYWHQRNIQEVTQVTGNGCGAHGGCGSRYSIAGDTALNTAFWITTCRSRKSWKYLIFSLPLQIHKTHPQEKCRHMACYLLVSLTDSSVVSLYSGTLLFMSMHTLPTNARCPNLSVKHTQNEPEGIFLFQCVLFWSF